MGILSDPYGISKLIDFWKSVRGLVCVCGFFDCGSGECRLVQRMKNEIKNRLNFKRAEDKE